MATKRSATSQYVELRGDMPREVADMLDAVSAARRMSRIELANKILAKWAEDKRHEAEVIQRVTNLGKAANGHGGRGDE